MSWLSNRAIRAEDDPDERFRKRVISVAAAGGLVVSLAGAVLMMLSDHRLAWQALLIYVGFVLTSLIAFALLKFRSDYFIWPHLVANLAITTVVSVAQGGLLASGGNPLWAMVAPLGALVFFRTRVAIGFILGFLASVAAVVVIPGFVDLQVPELRYPTFSALFNIVGPTLFVFSVLAYFVFKREEALQLVAQERARSDRLLANVLPAQVAEQLKRGESTITHNTEVTVLFADLVGFTPLSATTEPGHLVSLLDEVFQSFDDLVERHGLEKIKTIGDCYMLAAGVPTPRADHAEAMARFALDLRDLLASRDFGGRRMVFRMGMHSGAAVAGVIGRKRFIYDLWGDTVNTASRMEQHGLPGKIQLTDATRSRLGPEWTVEERGTLEIKGKGPMRLWLLEDGPRGR
jgi:adenylate cyclase